MLSPPLRVDVSFSDVDECASNPCSNGGVCNNLIDGFLCKCTRGFDGVVCDIGNFQIIIVQLRFSSIQCSVGKYPTLFSAGSGRIVVAY